MTLLPQSFLARLLGLLALLTVPWLVLVGHELLERHRQAEADGLAAVRQRSALPAREVDDTLQRNHRLLDFLAQRPEIVQADARACQALLAGLVGIDPALANAGLLDTQGRVVCASVGPGPGGAQIPPDDPDFQAALKSPSVYVGSPRWGPVVRRPVLAMVRAVQGDGGQTAGLVILTLDLTAWSRTWSRHAAGADGSALVVQNDRGLIVARYPEPEQWIGHDAREHYEAFIRRHPDAVGAGEGVDGVKRLYAGETLPRWGWKVVAGIPQAVVMAPTRAALQRAALGVAALTLVVLFLGWRLSRRLVTPLQHLAATAREVAQGRAEARADEHLPGEIGALAVEFNRMLDGRDEAQAQLAASERRFREMLDTVELFAIAVDAQGRMSYCNDFFLRRTGWRFEDLAGEDCAVCTVPPERREEHWRWCDEVHQGHPASHSELEVLTAAGERRLVRWNSTVLRDAHGVVVGRASIGEDVTDQRQAERQVRRLSGFLAALSRTQRAIIHRAEREVLLQAACDACVDAGQARIASAWWLTDDGLVATAWAGPAESLFGPMPARHDRHAPGFADTLVWQSLHEGRVAVSNTPDEIPEASGCRERARRAGVQAAVIFPLRCAGRVVGVLMLHVDEAGWFDEALVELLRQLSDDLAFALDNLARERARIEAERQAALGHRQFKNIFDASPMGIAVRTLDDGRLLDVNPVFAQRVGLPRERLLGHTMAELGVGMDEGDRDRLQALVRAHGRARDVEVRVRDARGRMRDVVMNVERIEFGDQPALLSLSHDVTARREAERRLAGIVDSAMDAIVSIDAAQRVVMFNRAACELFKVPAEAVMGHLLDDLVPPELLLRHKQGLQAFIDGDRDHVAIGRIHVLHGMRSDGTRFPFEAAVSRQGHGEGMTMTAVMRDLSDRVAAEAAREARVAAEAASRAKTDFLSRMSHELRTPLNAMLGFAQLLGDDPREPLSPRQHRHLALTREAGWHLLALIDDVLDVSRIEAGEVEMHLGPVLLQPLIESALSVSASLAERHQVRLAPAPPLPAGLAVHADATRLRQVVLNLLSNGCKYNRPGGRVAIEVLPDPPWTDGMLLLDVVDNGVGMSEAQLTRLFEPFNRLGREQGPVEGTGIGLHLSRQLVLKMGGGIDVDSAPGRGTRMRVALARASAAAPGHEAPASSSGLPPGPARSAAESMLEGRVLYVEDNPVNLMLVEQFLLRWPAVALTGADTGERGLARLRSERFDLVLLDMQLPDMHGTELLGRLRVEGLIDGVPVVALSASAMPEAVDAALDAGATEYWTKPLDLARLGADLKRFLRVAA